ncbi:uncharacterized protein VTP21DRAFT_4889 [Calcarisporiella thermophila]|uniref:uncharacterized protein n=1 Tax=Calcarisporiella thermophila TaxID=911321 RepID=UPI003742DAE6
MLPQSIIRATARSSLPRSSARFASTSETSAARPKVGEQSAHQTKGQEQQRTGPKSGAIALLAAVVAGAYLYANKKSANSVKQSTKTEEIKKAEG